ncbi:MAG: hypothetical protein NVS3B27_05240 [Novosphingobium sp.]
MAGNSAADAPAIQDGVRCRVVSGTHKGKQGMVEDRKSSKTGHVTITVRQDDGTRIKTLARSVVIEP